MSYNVDFTSNGESIATASGVNRSFIGFFWKLIFGQEGNFDITQKIMFGNKRNPISYNNWSGADYEKSANAVYRLGIGYTLTKPR